MEVTIRVQLEEAGILVVDRFSDEQLERLDQAFRSGGYSLAEGLYALQALILSSEKIEGSLIALRDEIQPLLVSLKADEYKEPDFQEDEPYKLTRKEALNLYARKVNQTLRRTKASKGNPKYQKFLRFLRA